MYILVLLVQFQDLEDVRAGLHLLDQEAGLPLPERNYAEECSSWAAVLVGFKY